MRIRRSVLALLFLAQASLPAQQPSNTGPSSSRGEDEESKLGPYVKREAGPARIAMAGAGAAINQANNTPSEWGQGAAGFGRRLASAFGKHIVHKAIQYPVSKLLHEELHYQRSNKQGFGPRLGAALMGTVVTRKTTTGKRTPAVGEISGAFGSGLLSRLWQPASVRTVGEGFSSGGITLAVDAGVNVVREFWPEIRHPHRHAAKAAPSQVTAASLKVNTGVAAAGKSIK